MRALMYRRECAVAWISNPVITLLPHPRGHNSTSAPSRSNRPGAAQLRDQSQSGWNERDGDDELAKRQGRSGGDRDSRMKAKGTLLPRPRELGKRLLYVESGERQLRPLLLRSILVRKSARQLHLNQDGIKVAELPMSVIFLKSGCLMLLLRGSAWPIEGSRTTPG